MLTGRQIKAARMLLEWTSDDLAERAGLSRDTISSVETGVAKPRGGTLERLERTFTDAGVEFIGNVGVTLRQHFWLLEGPDCWLRTMEAVYYELQGKPDAEALFVCVDDSISSDEVVAANKRLRDAGVKCRYLASEEATKFDYPKRDYRLIPAQFYKNVVTVIYGDCVASVRADVSGVLVTRDKEQADMLRRLFEMVWLHSKRPRGVSA